MITRALEFVGVGGFKSPPSGKPILCPEPVNDFETVTIAIY